MLEQLKEIFVEKVFHWERDNPHASVWCVVKELKWNGEEFWVRTTQVDQQCREIPETSHWNSLDRFIDSTSTKYFDSK